MIGERLGEGDSFLGSKVSGPIGSGGMGGLDMEGIRVVLEGELGIDCVFKSPAKTSFHGLKILTGWSVSKGLAPKIKGNDLAGVSLE